MRALASAAQTAPLLVLLRDLDATALPLAGGKAAQLGELIRAGLPVPEGFCVTTAAYRLGINGALGSQIAAAYRTLGAGPVAVRSSATAEDLADASFAGQQDTFLNVTGETAVLDAIERCWQSLFSERAVAYRRERKIGDDALGMAVIVQRMVAAESAGVLFTLNPVTGATDEMVVEAARGLGDAVVSARVTPARYRVARRAPHELLQAEGPESESLLSGAQLASLAGLGLRAERVLGRAADVEWALDSRQLWLLQGRAVTAVGGSVPEVEYSSDWNREHCRDRLIFWSNYNLRETMPYPHTPFSWSIWSHLLGLLAMAVWGKEDRQSVQEVPFSIDQVEGRAYFNLNVGLGVFQAGLGRFGLRLALAMQNSVDPEVGAFTAEHARTGELVPVGPSRRLWLRSVLPSLGLMVTALRNSGPQRAWRALRDSQQEAEDFRRIDLSALSDETILAMARYFVSQNTPRSMGPLFASLVFTLPIMAWLERKLPQWGFADAIPRLISGCGNPTMDTALALWEIAASAPAEVRQTFADSGIAQLPAKLAETAAGREFLAQVAAFLQVHGHRAVREWDFSCPRWRDDSTFVYEMLRNYLDHPSGQATPSEHYQEQLRERERVKREIEHALAHRPLAKWLFRRCMGSLEARLPLREAFKFYGMIGLAHLRDMYLEVGRRMASRGQLEASDDFFFLTIEELEQIAAGSLAAKVARGRIPQRRRNFVRQMRANPPLVVRSDGKPAMQPRASGAVLTGTPVSWGAVRGPVRVLLDPADGARLKRGEVLVAPFTDPGWTPLFLTAGALVMEVGGMISHGAMVAREYGIPAVVGVKDATRLLRDGEMVEVDGAMGTVRRLNAANP